jgi:pimeloyl-ACP methyl ester carboxylesterase
VWRDDAPPAAEYDTGARRALAALLGMDGASEEAAVAAASSTTTSRRRRRALLGVEVEQGMAPLSRYSATMQGAFHSWCCCCRQGVRGRGGLAVGPRPSPSPRSAHSLAPRKNPKKNPSKKTKTTDIVAPKGYPLEEHKVTTDDGFILTMHRIPAGKYRHTELPFGTLPETREAAAAAAGGDQPLPPPTKKPAVLLHHGITLSSASFAVLNANESLAYVLADAGFDVWMANSRGNTFSWAHTSDEEGGAARSATSATPKKEALRDPRYWQRTSMDDIALRDLPAQIDRVLQVTQTKRLGYVGHSQGCTLLLALLATKPEYNAKVTAAAQMGPVTYVKELQAPFLKGGIENKVDQLLKRLAWSDPMPTRVTAPVLAGACRRWPVGGSCAKGMAYSFYGPSVHMTPDDYVEIGSVWPAGVGELLLLGFFFFLRAPRLRPALFFLVSAHTPPVLPPHQHPPPHPLP